MVHSWHTCIWEEGSYLSLEHYLTQTSYSFLSSSLASVECSSCVCYISPQSTHSFFHMQLYLGIPSHEFLSLLVSWKHDQHCICNMYKMVTWSMPLALSDRVLPCSNDRLSECWQIPHCTHLCRYHQFSLHLSWNHIYFIKSMIKIKYYYVCSCMTSLWESMKMCDWL